MKYHFTNQRITTKITVEFLGISGGYYNSFETAQWFFNSCETTDHSPFYVQKFVRIERQITIWKVYKTVVAAEEK